jgi:carboxypeptidase family protein
MLRAAPTGQSEGRKFPTWAWVVLLGAIAAVVFVVFNDHSEPVDPANPQLPTVVEPDPMPPTDPDFGSDLAGPGDLPTLLEEDGLILVELRYLGGIEEERIRPKRSGSLEGQVINEKRIGIGGVRLQIVGGPQDGWSAVSRADGHYHFPELLPGTHFFRLTVPGYGTTVRSQRVRTGDRTRRNFRVANRVGVQLEIRDFENKPLPGARVIADLEGYEVLTDENGLALLDGLVGGDRVMVTIRAEGHVPVRQELNLIVQPMNAGPIQVPALPKGAVIHGQVLSWPGAPLPRVSVVPRSNRIGTHKIAWETWQGVEVQADGRFTLENLPTSHLIDVRVSHPKGVANPVSRALKPMLQSPTTIKFTIQRGKGRVKGKVVDLDNQPIVGAKLVLEATDPAAMLGQMFPGLADVPSTSRLPVPAAMRRELRCNRRGGFDFAVGDHPQGTGSLVLTASAPGYQPKRQSIGRSYENLVMKLHPEDHSGELILVQANGEVPEVEWYLDGQLFEGATGNQAPGLLTGVYELIIRSGDQNLLHQSEFTLQGPKTLTVR